MGHVPPSTSNNFIFSSLWSKSDSQLSKYCVVCEISWCRCQQLAALSISTALVTKLLVIEQLLHLALESIVIAPWHNFHLYPSSQQMLATPLIQHIRAVTWHISDHVDFYLASIHQMAPPAHIWLNRPATHLSTPEGWMPPCYASNLELTSTTNFRYNTN